MSEIVIAIENPETVVAIETIETLVVVINEGIRGEDGAPGLPGPPGQSGAGTTAFATQAEVLEGMRQWIFCCCDRRTRRWEMVFRGGFGQCRYRASIWRRCWDCQRHL